MSSEGSGRPLYDAAGMRAIDRWAIETQGVPSLELMEAAGAALAREAERRAAAGSESGPIRVVCGKGNNGGDGFVAARLLRRAGHPVDVLLLWPESDSKGDAAVNLGRLEGDWRQLGANPAADLEGSAVIIDAIFGTGFSGEPEGIAREAIAAISAQAAAGTPIVACDVPSGLDASTGELASAAIDASTTVSFHAAKAGMFVAPGKLACGEVVVAPIGIPSGAPIEPAAATIGRAALAALPGRTQRSTKFSSGEVLVVGGSKGMTGAPCMAARAAARGGAGYVTVGVPSSLEAIFEIKLTEQMSLALDDVDGSLTPAAVDELLERGKRASAALVGPGLGRRDEAAELARQLAPRIDAPLVLDADGLNALGTGLESLASRQRATILTPHAGELARLLGTDSFAVSARRLDSARRASDLSGAVVVLKGDDTIITDGDRVLVNEVSAPGLATAGTGDVLAGLIAALLARGCEALDAAATAVLAHARAGRIAAAERCAESVVAGDVIEALPRGLDPLEEVR